MAFEEDREKEEIAARQIRLSDQILREEVAANEARAEDGMRSVSEFHNSKNLPQSDPFAPGGDSCNDEMRNETRNASVKKQ